MEETAFLADSIASRYGSIRRARGVFLYTAKGQRLTDLYAEGGRAILGWGGSPAVTAFKDVLSRGICGSFRTDWDYRLDKALSDLLGFKAVSCVFASLQDAQNALAECPVRWRPWSGKSYAECPAVIVEPPFPMTEGISLLAVRQESDLPRLPARSIAIPAPLKAALARSLYDVIRAEKERQEKNFFIYDKVLTRYWTRQGPWLTPKLPRERYRDFLLHCLDCTLVISPRYEQESIVPFGADPGVFRVLERRPFEF